MDSVLRLGFRWIKTVYLLLLLMSQTGADEEDSGCLFVSHLTVKIHLNVVSSVAPCRTLPQALLLVHDGGKICLDGRESVGMRQEESSAHACQKSTLEVTDSEFWYNKKSIFVFLFNEFFNLTISRCLFQGKKGQFKIATEARNTTENNKKNDEPFRKEFDFEVHVRLQNVTFQGLHDCALSVGTDKNAYGLILVKNCKFLNNHQFVYRLDERATVQIEFKNDDPPNVHAKEKGTQMVNSHGMKKSRLPVIFEDTTFEGNVGISGALNLLNGNVTFKNCTFKNNEGVTMGGHVYMKTATKSSSINIDKLSSLRCPTGKQINFEKITKRDGFDLVKGSDACWINVNYIKLFCEECFDGFYTLQRGSTNGLDVNKDTECLKCPHGATSRPPSLKFIPCPLEYCNTPTHSYHYTYNGCHGSRSGVLCGQCSDGYSEVLYSTSCRKKEKCNDHWFWLASFIYVVVFALYVVFKPPIFSLLYRQSLWFRKKPEASPNEESCDEHDAGYLKIIFYFYQVAELVMIKSPENALHMVPFITPVMALFNFKVKTMNGSIGCPFPGLNVVTKELFMCLKFLATLASIASIYAIHRGINTTLKLMHCVPIGLEWRLFVDGNIQCWQWWQYLLIVFIVVFVIPLVLVLFWGSLMLSKDKVSAKEFLTSCAFPLPFLFIWLFRYCKKRPNANQFDCQEGIPTILKKSRRFSMIHSALPPMTTMAHCIGKAC
ncbi:hypothetical protein OS493_013134 [Desmophyllum pertusum]|uniref:Uncharacterized protein n=1 Tax=Desmophyllum pertusum TaxID=174260 RepID=A0A9X0CLF3_9CNID|nr:hypothetical protein OS493_013134 [Desmophyllum pertusum]